MPGGISDVTNPTAREVSKFHTNADTDGSTKAIHHTLGPGPNQAAAGNHTHDGGGTTTLDLGIGQWQAFTTSCPLITALGNGTIVARYTQDGKTVKGYIRFVVGSTTTIAAGTWTFSLPVAAAQVSNDVVGNCFLLDSSAGSASRTIGGCVITSSSIFLVAAGTTATSTTVTNAYPWTWAAGDTITLNFEYEAA
jgi:hypothetical protein